METALKIIAICEVIRLIQNTIQLFMVSYSKPDRYIKRATDAFVDNMSKTSDVEYILNAIKDFKENEK